MLYKHQQKFLNQNPNKALLLWEAGLGKSLAACEWIKKRPGCNALVACPKAIVGKWKTDLKDADAVADVVTRDTIKKIDLSHYDAIVLDEAQDYASPLFAGGRSKRSAIVYNHIRKHPNTHVLLLSATPVRSSAWNIHTLACFLGVFWQVNNFRDEFFFFTDMFGRFHYEPKKDWRVRVRTYIESVSDIVLMRDCFDVPQQKEHIMNFETPPLPEEHYEDAAADWHTRHRWEQGDTKTRELEHILLGYRKIIVVCYYTEQIERYARAWENERQVYVLHGKTKDATATIHAAQDADDCVFIIQADMGVGFDADKFSVMVFASMSFKYVSYVQMKGRVKRAHNLHENLFIHLIAGEHDQAVFDAIQSGKDFDPIHYR